MAAQAAARPLYAEGYEPPEGVLSRGVMGMYVFIASEFMFFGTFFAVYYYLFASRFPNWPPVPMNGFHLVDFWPIPVINTLLLVPSSGTYMLMEYFLVRGRRQLFIAFLVITILMGTGFEIGQATEYIKHDVFHTYNATEFASAFYTMTGFHGAHVFGGIILMLVLLYRTVVKGHFTPLHHVAVRGVGIYWHFVDFIWIMLLLNLYLIPDYVLANGRLGVGG